MQRPRVQLYTGTCTRLACDPLYLQLATDWAVPHPGDPPQWGTRVSLSLITSLTPACRVCNPPLLLLLLRFLIRGKDTVVSSPFPYIHLCTIPSHFLPLASLQAVCLSARTCCPTPVPSPRPLPSLLGTMWRKGLGFVSMSRPWHQPQGERT